MAKRDAPLVRDVWVSNDRWPDSKDLGRYFSLLRYDFTEGYQRGLMRFFELAYEAGELEEIPELRFIDQFALDVPAVLVDVDPGDAVPEIVAESEGAPHDEEAS